MANRPEVALAALVHRLVLQVFRSGYASNRIVQVNIEKTHLKPDAENIEQSRAIYGRQPLYFQDAIFQKRAEVPAPIASDRLSNLV